MEGVIFDIKRFAIHDGPGIRTTVFLKGCPLNCFWCHNPESRKTGVEPIRISGNDKKEDLGRKISVDELLQELLLDKVFYEHSGGGVSFSGGEPTLQSEFLESILINCKEHGIHTVVDTSGFTRKDVLKRIIPYTDLFLYDLKMVDQEKHMKYVGVKNTIILENLSYLIQQGAEVDLRLPVLPGYNDSREDLEALISMIDSMGHKGKIHLLSYHRTGIHKYKKFCLEIPEYSIEQPDEKYVAQIVDLFNHRGMDVIIGG